MNEPCEVLSLLLRFPKKKYMKKLFQTCVILNGSECSVNMNFSTPIMKLMQNELQQSLTIVQIHQLVLQCISIIKQAIRLQLNKEAFRGYLGGLQIQEELVQVIQEIVLSLEEQIRQKQKQKVVHGSQIDLDALEWDLSLESINNKGKANTPIVSISLPLVDFQKAQSRQVAFQMKGEQFQVFFSNLTKIKETLSELVAENQPEQS